MVEAGINQPGEMQQLANMISPDYAVVTLVGESHLEGLGSVEKVADEKSKIFNISGNNSKIMFPESCQAFAPYKEKSLEGRNHIVLRSGEPHHSKISKSEAYFDLRTETETKGSRDATALASRVPIFSINFDPISLGMSNMALALLVASEMGINDKIFSNAYPNTVPRLCEARPCRVEGTSILLIVATPILLMIDSLISSVVQTLKSINSMYWVEWKSW